MSCDCGAGTQCVANALAGGTGNALTIPLLPCALSTNILILTLSATNSGPATLQMAGYPALAIQDVAGNALGSGALVSGSVVLLTCTGTAWRILISNPYVTPLAPSSGGTGISSYTIGDMLYASGATTLAKLADVATGNALISGGVGVAPSWGKVALATAVSGALPKANGGTASTTGAGGAAALSMVYTVGQQNTAVSHTGDTSEALVASFQIPAGMLGTNGALRLFALTSRPAGQVATSVLNIRFGTANDLTGTLMLTLNVGSTSRSLSTLFYLSNRNSASSQVSQPTLIGTSSTTAISTSAINTANASWIVVSVTNGNNADTMAAEAVVVEYLPVGGN